MFHLLESRTSIDIFRTEKCEVTFGLKYIIYMYETTAILIQNYMEIWDINLKISLKIQTSLIISNVL